MYCKCWTNSIGFFYLFCINSSKVYCKYGLPSIEDTLIRTMTELGKQGAFAKSNNGEYLFKVTVPNIEDTSATTGLTVDDYINRVLRNVKIDFTLSTEIEEIDGYFSKMYNLKKEYEKKYNYCSELSMGMSNDYIEALKNGATILRIGSKLYW